VSAKNRRVIVAAAKAQGAIGVEFESGRKHDKYRITLPGGITAHDTISHSNHDPFKIRGWIRQRINEAKRAA
jgi:hypothetical protein